jgi:molybdopterin/thiamine biosynthesis adenylyltransferase/rhodanese-related sulfurtransferase
VIETRKRDKVTELDPQDFHKMMSSGVIIDVREKEELASGYIKDSLHIPLSEIEKRKEEIKKGNLFFYCSKGQRSLIAGRDFPGSYSLRGGLELWKQEGLPFLSDLPGDEAHHYSRQILLPEISLAGQKRIRAASVMVVGGGGLGSPASLYLAAAGIGRIGIIDDDVVEKSNLPRQIIYQERQEGKSKAQSAKESLEALNSDSEIIPFKMRLDRDNIFALLKEGWDVIIDGSDNFPTRYLLNDVSKRLGIPLISASILGFQGQISTFLADGPCYRCIWPEPPPREFAPSCSEAGILGTVSGLFGILQANEALKIIARFGTTLSGKLLLVDLSDNSWHTLKIQQRQDCGVCAGREEDLPDYEVFCATSI